MIFLSFFIIISSIIYCKKSKAVIKKEIESKILYEDEDFLVFLDIDQSTPGHTLIIPKKHFQDYTALDQNTLNNLFTLACVSPCLTKNIFILLFS